MNLEPKRRAVRVWTLFFTVLTVLFLAFTVGILSVGAYLETHFETELPADFLDFPISGAAPEFYVYTFEDRVNRTGTAEKLTDTGIRQTSVYTPISDLPEQLTDTFVAIEDKRFSRHRGVDWLRTAAASVNYLLGFSDTFGASTITQQLVKNVTGDAEVTVRRKIQEMLWATELERNFDKSEIMERYLNVISFSDGCVGIGAAAEHYFSKTPAELTLAEGATLAAIINNPSYYHPIRAPEHNLARRNLILSELYAQEKIDAEAYRNALASPLALSVNETDTAVRSWYLDMVLDDVTDDLVREYGLSRAAASRLVFSGGLRIDLAMDPEIQRTVENYYRERINVPTNRDGVRAQSALIVIDSRTGDILGVAGAVGEKNGDLIQNYATQAKRPPGSAIKPVTVYAPALENGIITWSSVYDDVPVRFPDGKTAWPRNANGVYRGLCNIPYAVSQSTNTVAVRILQDLGTDVSFRMAKERFHLTSLIEESGKTDKDLAALALGQLNYGLTLRELTNAYTVFADAGAYHPCRSYYRVLKSDGTVLLSKPDASEIVLSPGNAAIMTKLLQGVIRTGTSSSVTLGTLTECAGKTGTTNGDCDRWFIGYTPELICGVWCGYEYPEPLIGKNLCTTVWNDVMHEIVASKGGKTVFDLPNSVVRVSYCKDSGKLAGTDCGLDPRGNRTETGWFVRGTEPSEPCDRHVLCRVADETGGVLRTKDPESGIPAALIRAARRFPVRVLITDAQYIYRDDPLLYEPNPDASQAYFEADFAGQFGTSGIPRPFNRSAIPLPEELPKTLLPRSPWREE